MIDRASILPAASAATVFFLILLLALPASAMVRISGIEFAPSVTIGDAEVPLRGGGLFRYAVVFRVYTGALYAPVEIPASEILDTDAPKRLELHYLMTISGDDFRRSGNALLEKQQPPAVLASLADRLETFNAAYRDVEPGDRYALEYHPDFGTRLLKNGEELVRVPGRDFARVYFGIWLDPQEPLSARFRDDLLS